MSVEVNPPLGKGSDTVRLMTLQQIKSDQQAIVAQMGLSNPICGVVEMMNTQTDMLQIANIKNVNRYFKMPNPQQLQQPLHRAEGARRDDAGRASAVPEG